LAKTFDATTKQLIEAHAADWLAFAGLPMGTTIRVVDADVSSFTACADKVIWVDGPFPYIAHFELQSGADAYLDLRVLLYNALLRWRHKVPVISVVILLRPAASPAAVTGRVLDLAHPESQLDFRYKIIRVWEQPAEALLAGGIGTLPLAPISDVKPADLAAVVERVEQRLESEAPAEARDLETATYILMGLRYPQPMIRQLLKRVRQMKESVTYQAILEEGEARGVAIGEARGLAKGTANGERALLLRIATKKLGAPDSRHVSKLNGISQVQKIEAIGERLLEANSWDELLADAH